MCIYIYIYIHTYIAENIGGDRLCHGPRRRGQGCGIMITIMHIIKHNHDNDNNTHDTINNNNNTSNNNTNDNNNNSDDNNACNCLRRLGAEVVIDLRV